MFVTGAVSLPFFSFMSFLIAVPTGVKFFNWIGTMWGGAISFDTPMLWAIGFLTTFLFGGLTGIILASPPLDFQVSDTYFVVAHFHYVLFGTVVFAMFGGFYYWWPKLTGRMLNETWGQDPLLDPVRRLPHDLPRPALAGRRGDAAANRGLPADRGLHAPQPDLHVRRLPPGRLDAAVVLEPVDLAQLAVGQHRRPVGLGPVAGVGHKLASASAQLREPAADPQRGTGVRPPPPRHGG